jgi:hypothetical protein
MNPMPWFPTTAVVLYPAWTFPRVDAIRAHSSHLVSALAARGIDARLHGSVDHRLPEALDGADLLIVQYNPLAYGRWGFAPRLPYLIARARRRQPAMRTAAIVHETFSEPDRLRSWPPAIWQRLQLFTVARVVDVMEFAIGRWAERLDRWSPGSAAHHLPSPSNLPDMSAERERARLALGVAEGDLVAATFGAAHVLRMTAWIVAGANALTGLDRTVHLLNLAAEAPSFEGLRDDVRLVTPGELEDEELASHIAAADVVLLPWRDGASTKRSTLMAALQHGRPVVSTVGENTDPVLRSATDAVRLVSVHDRPSFVEATVAMGRDPAVRARTGQEARALYARCFDWPVLVDRLLAHVGSP